MAREVRSAFMKSYGNFPLNFLTEASMLGFSPLSSSFPSGVREEGPRIPLGDDSATLQGYNYCSGR